MRGDAFTVLRPSPATPAAPAGAAARWPSVLAAALVMLLLVPAQIQVRPAVLMGERFLPGLGWLQIALLAGYAAWLARKLQDPARIRRWRPRLWRLFSLVFFGQLVLGLAGLEIFLMTGKLHLPVPALIVAGPLYRGGGLFMPILFLATVVLVGPAWCSWLCYIGSWDDAAARTRRRATSRLRHGEWIRAGMLILAGAGAWLLGRSGAPTAAAVTGGAAIGLIGVAVMVTASRRLGLMVHCTAFCPMGWLATRLGRLHPVKLRVGSGCTDCGACTSVCRYGALSSQDLASGRPGSTCTLCLDCLASCRSSHLRLAGGAGRSRLVYGVYVALLVALHAAFLGAARI